MFLSFMRLLPDLAGIMAKLLMVSFIQIEGLLDYFSFNFILDLEGNVE